MTEDEKKLESLSNTFPSSKIGFTLAFDKDNLNYNECVSEAVKML